MHKLDPLNPHKSENALLQKAFEKAFKQSDQTLEMVDRTVEIAVKNYEKWWWQKQIDEMSDRAIRISNNVYFMLPEYMRGTNNQAFSDAIGIAVDKELPRKPWYKRIWKKELWTWKIIRRSP